MNELLKFLGMGLIILSAIAFFREYKSYLEYRCGICQGFLSLISHIRRQIECYLTPADRLLCDFGDDFLKKCGYLERAGSIGVREAYFEMEDRLRLPSEAREILRGLFSNFGKDYREGTLRELDSGVASFEKCLAKERLESEKELKIAGILAVCAALGIVILII